MTTFNLLFNFACKLSTPLGMHLHEHFQPTWQIWARTLIYPPDCAVQTLRKLTFRPDPRFARELATPPQKFALKLSTAPHKFACKLSHLLLPLPPRKLTCNLATHLRKFACKLSLPIRRISWKITLKKAESHLTRFLSLRRVFGGLIFLVSKWIWVLRTKTISATSRTWT